MGVAPHSATAAPASALSKLHAAKLQVNATTSPLSPMPWFSMGVDLAPPGHANVAVGTTPAHEGGFGAHTMAAAGACVQVHPVAAHAAAGHEPQRNQSTNSGHDGHERAQQGSQAAAESVSLDAAAASAMHVNAAARKHSMAHGVHGEGSNDAALDVGVVSQGPDAGAAHCQAIGAVADEPGLDEPGLDDPWCGPDGDDFMYASAAASSLNTCTG